MNCNQGVPNTQVKIGYRTEMVPQYVWNKRGDVRLVYVPRRVQVLQVCRLDQTTIDDTVPEYDPFALSEEWKGSIDDEHPEEDPPDEFWINDFL